MAKSVKIAIIGLGHIGKIHIKAIISNPHYELIAICDKEESCKALLESVDFYSDYTQMLQRGGYEVVVVATPNLTHAIIAQEVLESGYDVILEKPAGNCIEQLQILQECAKNGGQNIYYAFHAAYASEVLWFEKHYLEHKEIYGEMESFSSHFYDPYFKEMKLLDVARGLDTSWYDSGVNALSVLEKFLKIDDLQMRHVRVSKYYEQEISTTVEFELKQGTFGFIQTAWDQGVNFKSTKFYFQNGITIELHHTKQQVIREAESTEVLIAFEGERLFNHYKNIFDDYIKRVRHKEDNATQSMAIHSKLFEVGEKNGFYCY